MGTQEIQCESCKKNFTTTMPRAEVLNGRTVSMVVLGHAQTVDCPACGQAHQMLIEGIGGLRVRWIPVRDEEAPRLIVPEGHKVQA